MEKRTVSTKAMASAQGKEPRVYLQSSYAVLRVLGVLSERPGPASVAILTLMILTVLGQLYDLAPHISSILEVSRRMPTLGHSILAVFKLATMMANRASFRRMLVSLDEHFGAERQFTDPAHVAAVQACDRRARTIHKIYTSTVTVAVLLPWLGFALHPFDPELPANETRTLADVHFPYKVSFPMGTSHWYTFLLMLLVQIGVVWYIFVVPSADCFLFGLIGHAATHLRVLQAELRELLPPPERCGADLLAPPELQRQARRRLAECARHHRAVLQFVSDLNMHYSMVLLLLTLASLGSYCTAVITIKSSPPDVAAFMVVTMVVSQLQFFMFCYFADSVKEQSLAVAAAAYEAHFPGGSPALTRSLMIVIERARRAAVLTVGSFFELSINTYAEVLRLSYTFFTVLNETS